MDKTMNKLDTQRRENQFEVMEATRAAVVTAQQNRERFSAQQPVFSVMLSIEQQTDQRLLDVISRKSAARAVRNALEQDPKLREQRQSLYLLSCAHVGESEPGWWQRVTTLLGVFRTRPLFGYVVAPRSTDEQPSATPSGAVAASTALETDALVETVPIAAGPVPVVAASAPTPEADMWNSMDLDDPVVAEKVLAILKRCKQNFADRRCVEERCRLAIVRSALCQGGVLPLKQA